MPPAGHLFQGVDSHLAQLWVGAELGLLQEQQDRVCLRELGRVAEAAVLRVVGIGHRIEDCVDHPVFERGCAPGDSCAGAFARLEHAGRDLGLVGPVIARDAGERVGHLVRRQVGRAGEDVA